MSNRRRAGVIGSTLITAGRPDNKCFHFGSKLPNISGVYKIFPFLPAIENSAPSRKKETPITFFETEQASSVGRAKFTDRLDWDLVEDLVKEATQQSNRAHRPSKEKKKYEGMYAGDSSDICACKRFARIFNRAFVISGY